MNKWLKRKKSIFLCFWYVSPILSSQNLLENVLRLSENKLKENYRIIYTTNIICDIIHFFPSEISTAYPDCNILKRARKSYLKYLWKEKGNQEFYG